MRRVLFLQQQPCIRTLKYAAGLRHAVGSLRLGFACQGRTLTEWYGEGDELFDKWWRLDPDAPDLTSVIDEFRPDVIHSHNLPDRLTVEALAAVNGGVPVVHDAHDLWSLRATPYEDGMPDPADPALLEKQAVGASAAVVAVSPEMAGEITARHGSPRRLVCFANYALGRDLPAELPAADRPIGRPPRLVYQGTLSTNGGHYDLRAIFSALVRGGVTLDVYPSRPVLEYQDLAEATPGLTYHDMLAPRRLMEVLGAYDFGWAGFNDALNRPHIDTALPNKVFEYVGCGLPVLTLGHRALRRFVNEHGVGISLSSLDSLGERLASADVLALRRRVAAARTQMTIEANIGRVIELYDEVTAT